jgi:hypothetical protein
MLWYGHSALQVDKFALDALNENAEGYMRNLEQWVMVCANYKLYQLTVHAR